MKFEHGKFQLPSSNSVASYKEKPHVQTQPGYASIQLDYDKKYYFMINQKSHIDIHKSDRINNCERKLQSMMIIVRIIKK